MNLGETATDCGGTCRNIRKCQLAERCAVDADCFNNVCAVAFNPPVLACLECRIDSDCDRFGSPSAFRCHSNFCFECAINSDCPRPGQRPEQNKCVEPFIGATCPPGKPCVCRACRDEVDCPQGQLCDETGACVPCAQAQGGQVHAAQCIADCTNGVKDGDETDVDCGGSCAQQFPFQQCAVGQQCLGNADCASEVCEGNTCRECRVKDHCSGIKECVAFSCV